MASETENQGGADDAKARAAADKADKAEKAAKAAADKAARDAERAAQKAARDQAADTPAGRPARLCDPSDRAGDGQRRFKLRCTSEEGRQNRYVLADTEADARALYLAVEKLRPDAVIHVTALPD